MDNSEARAALDGHMPVAIEPSRAVGRPNGYNEEIAGKICDLIAKRHSVDEIAEMDGFPGRSTVFRWLAEHEEFAKEYAIAMQWREESHLDQVIAIALDGTKDFEIKLPGEGDAPGITLVEVKDSVPRSKLGIDTIFRVIEHKAAKKYRLDSPLSEPGTGGDGAKEINPRAPTIIEGDPCKTALDACARAAKEPLPTAG